MPITVVVGGQYGSEGKGKVAAYLAEMSNASIVIRCGGSNSGHTVYDKFGKKYVFRQLPTSAILNDVKCVLAAGSYIDVDVLLSEIELINLDSRRLLVDPYSVVITAEHKRLEKSSKLTENIGSTGSGTGAALKERISREHGIKFAKDHPKLKSYIFDTKPYINEALRNKQRVIIEGTQGFGLSVLHSKEYPFVTSRDTTAAGFLSESGLSPIDVDEVVLVIRTFPIRVAGNSGDLKNEISWMELVKECGLNEGFVERTTVTNKVRRIGRFDTDIVQQAITSNNPTKIVLNHLDYIREEDRKDYVKWIESEIQHKVDYVGLDPLSLKEIECNSRPRFHVV